MRLLITAFATLVLTAQVVAAEQPKLFKTWAYNTPIASFNKAQGFYDCSADFGGKAVCKDGIEFLEHNFTAVLIPADERLAAVMLASEFDQDTYIKTVGALAKSFTMVSMRGASDQFDILESLHASQNAQLFQKRINDYETLNLNQGQLTYTFIEQPAQDIRKFKSAHAAISNAPNTARSAELIVFDDAEQSALLIKFQLPKLFLENMRNSVKNTPKEDF
jgi:hypothetical protein